MTFPILKTERLDLVEISDQHLQSYFDIMSKDDVMKYYGMESLKNPEEAAKFIEHFHNNYESKRGIRWGIILKDTQKFVGTIGLNNLNVGSRKAEIGFELHPCIGGRE